MRFPRKLKKDIKKHFGCSSYAKIKEEHSNNEFGILHFYGSKNGSLRRGIETFVSIPENCISLYIKVGHITKHHNLRYALLPSSVSKNNRKKFFKLKKHLLSRNVEILDFSKMFRFHDLNKGMLMVMPNDYDDHPFKIISCGSIDHLFREKSQREVRRPDVDITKKMRLTKEYFI